MAVAINSENVIKKLYDFLVGKCFSLLDLWEVVVDVFQKKLIVQSEISDKF